MGGGSALLSIQNRETDITSTNALVPGGTLAVLLMPLIQIASLAYTLMTNVQMSFLASLMIVLMRVQ